MFKYYHSSFYI